jgi:hypothetical protein
MSLAEDLRQNSTEMNKRKNESFLTTCRSFQTYSKAAWSKGNGIWLTCLKCFEHLFSLQPITFQTCINKCITKPFLHQVQSPLPIPEHITYYGNGSGGIQNYITVACVEINKRESQLSQSSNWCEFSGESAIQQSPGHHLTGVKLKVSEKLVHLAINNSESI